MLAVADGVVGTAVDLGAADVDCHLRDALEAVGIEHAGLGRTVPADIVGVAAVELDLDDIAAHPVAVWR